MSVPHDTRPLRPSLIHYPAYVKTKPQHDAQPAKPGREEVRQNLRIAPYDLHPCPRPFHL